MDEYWQRVGEIRAVLDPVNVIVADGVAVEADAETAAARIADGTHRLATDAEVERLKSAQGRSKRLHDARADVAVGKFSFGG